MTQQAITGDRGAMDWLTREHKKQRRRAKRQRGNPSKTPATDGPKSLQARNQQKRLEREKKRYSPAELPYEVTGTTRRLSVPVNARLQELLPFASAEEIRKALQKHQNDADAALDELLDSRIMQVGQTIAPHVLQQHAESDLGKSFLNFTPDPWKAAQEEQVMQVVASGGTILAPEISASVDDLQAADAGIRRALLIGINYIGTSRALKGCIDDAKNMKKLLVNIYGFPDNEETITILSDDNPNPMLRPTRQNILLGCKWLTSDAVKGSVLFFHYSGHGGQKRNLLGTEVDGFDETIMPMDYKEKGHIIDDDLFRYLVAPLPSGVKLVCLMDCCHSGSGMDLPFIWDSVKHRWEREPFPKFAAADVQLLAGCKDAETSADYHIPDKESGGAMTKALRQTLATNPYEISYPQLMRSIENFLSGWGFKQRPQLSSTQEFTFDRKFGLITTIVPNTNRLLGQVVDAERQSQALQQHGQFLAPVRPALLPIWAPAQQANVAQKKQWVYREGENPHSNAAGNYPGASVTPNFPMNYPMYNQPRPVVPHGMSSNSNVSEGRRGSHMQPHPVTNMAIAGPAWQQQNKQRNAAPKCCNGASCFLKGTMNVACMIVDRVAIKIQPDPEIIRGKKGLGKYYRVGAAPRI